MNEPVPGHTTPASRPIDARRRGLLLTLGGLPLAGTLASGCAQPGPTGLPGQPASTRAHIRAIVSDKAAYKPGAPVRLQVLLSMPAAHAHAPATAPAMRLVLQYRHLDVAVGSELSMDLALASGPWRIDITWQPPATDFRGYTIEASLVDAAGQLLDFKLGAVDVSSIWTKFPRYGYLTDYSGTHGPESYIAPLNALHINALQFYDWQWKHHQPIKGQPGQADAQWPELANKTVRLSAVQGLIAAAHARGMVALQYNLIYGAAADFADHGVDPAWRLFEDAAGKKPWRFGPFPEGWTTPYLYIFNPVDTGWQRYILDRELEVFQTLDFDGWHADTVGDWGLRYTANGQALDIKTTFKPFLQAARARLGGRQLVMNVVGAKGHTEVNTSPIDVAYMEIWPWDGFPDYKSLKDIIDVTRAETGGKSLVVPAYMNYEYGKTRSESAPGLFNDPGVLLTEATVMAAGGVRFELGDGGRMLCHEYFPNRSLVMGEALQAAIQRYWDFLVAYQNLLRDGQQDVARTVACEGVALSADARKDTVWAYARRGPGHEVLHFINLLGVRHTQWRDEAADQTAPRAVQGLQVKVHTEAGLGGQAWFASPDHEGGRAIALPLTQGRDAQGRYVQITLPVLRYWSMVWLKTPLTT